MAKGYEPPEPRKRKNPEDMRKTVAMSPTFHALAVRYARLYDVPIVAFLESLIDFHHKCNSPKLGKAGK